MTLGELNSEAINILTKYKLEPNDDDPVGNIKRASTFDTGIKIKFEELSEEASTEYEQDMGKIGKTGVFSGDGRK
jgi:hypothetical protein